MSNTNANYIQNAIDCALKCLKWQTAENIAYIKTQHYTHTISVYVHFLNGDEFRYTP